MAGDMKNTILGFKNFLRVQNTHRIRNVFYSKLDVRVSVRASFV